MSTIRVQAEKLDRLVDLVGELVTAQARISRIAEHPENHSGLADVAEELESLTTRLRDETMGIRMVPIGSVVGSFKRLVRDLGKDLGKDIEFRCTGEETELDKGVIDRLKDPLVHIIRNSVDHGIEAPDEREAKGKPRQGLVHLDAMHAGAHVVVRIVDDGKGLDAQAIRKKGIEKGLIGVDQELSEAELFQLIFAPGFSTAAKISEVSGRGVGMDVVRQNIEALRGSVQLKSSIDKGTTITLKLPLTLAIIDGLMVRLDQDNFIIPLSSVEECVDLNADEIERIRGRNILNLRSVAVPFVRLREKLGRHSHVPKREQVVITNVEGRQLGVVVDEVIGSHQTVLKNLGQAMRKAKFVSGATILGDGSVALILDLQNLQ
jgi:two-component system, chemotaxis family, sensor kinase CheA